LLFAIVFTTLIAILFAPLFAKSLCYSFAPLFATLFAVAQERERKIEGDMQRAVQFKKDRDAALIQEQVSITNTAMII
jgi:hypothetical protein